MKEIWALFDAADKLFGTFESELEAHEDAWGPRFRPAYRVVKFERTKTLPRKTPLEKQSHIIRKLEAKS